MTLAFSVASGVASFLPLLAWYQMDERVIGKICAAQVVAFAFRLAAISSTGILWLPCSSGGHGVAVSVADAMLRLVACFCVQ